MRINLNVIPSVARDLGARGRENLFCRHLPPRFLATLGMTLLLLVAALPALAQDRIALLQIESFPTIDAPVIAKATLDEALSNLPLDRISDLEGLTKYGTLVLPYGSAFPVDSWPHIRAFIGRGGNLVVLGGAPFHQPVLSGNRLGVRQPTWAHELLIGPVDEIDVRGMTPVIPEPSWNFPIAGATKAYALTLRLSRQPD